LIPRAENQRDQTRLQFLRTFLHDLATPLSAVSLHLEGASRRAARGDDPSASLDIARAELDRAFDLFERGRELLLARPSEVGSFAFDDWVEATLQRFGSDRIRLEGETGGRVAGDPEKLSEALSSLLVNALEGSPPGPVVVARERDTERLKVRVENPGRLSGEDPEQLFAPRSARAGRNWGMGLARARLYAADAGGAVRLSQEGDRVSAVLELPEESSA